MNFKCIRHHKNLPSAFVLSRALYHRNPSPYTYNCLLPSMPEAIRILCGQCAHDSVLINCYSLILLVILKILLVFILGWSNAKGKYNTDSSAQTFMKLLAFLDSISCLLPLFYSFQQGEVVYISLVNFFCSVLIHWLTINLFRSLKLEMKYIVCTSTFIGGYCAIICYDFIRSVSPKDNFHLILLLSYAVQLVSFIGIELVLAHSIITLACFSGVAYRKLSFSSSNRISLFNYDISRFSESAFLNSDSFLGGEQSPLLEQLTDLHSIETEPYESYYSVLFLSWMNDVFLRAMRNPLQISDSPPLPPYLHCQPNATVLAALWTEKRSLVQALGTIYMPTYLMIGWFLLFNIPLSFLGPIMLNALVDCAEKQASWTLISFYIAIMFLSRVIGAFLTAHYSFRCQQLSIAISAGLKGALYRKILRLSIGGRQKYTVGNITNLCTIDIEKVVEMTIGLHNFWSLTLEV